MESFNYACSTTSAVVLGVKEWKTVTQVTCTDVEAILILVSEEIIFNILFVNPVKMIDKKTNYAKSI